MTDETPLSLDGALGMLIVNPEDTNSAPPAAGASDANSAAPTGDNSAPAQGEAPPADDAAANTDAPADQGNTTDGTPDQGDALPPIEAPSSWSTEEKAEWPSLSRKAQEAILRRDQAASAEVRKLQNSTAEQRKAADAEVTRLKGLAEQIDGYLNEKLGDLARDFPDIKNEADLVALGQNDPGRYTAFQARLQAIATANNSRLAAQRELQTKANEQQQATHAKAKEAILEAFPSWSDPEVARREVTELQDYVVKEMGVPEATARATIDPTVYKLAQKAMLYDRAQAAAKSALTRTPPKTVKPGAQSVDPRTSSKDETRRSQFGKLTQSGDIEDARGLLRI